MERHRGIDQPSSGIKVKPPTARPGALPKSPRRSDFSGRWKGCPQIGPWDCALIGTASPRIGCGIAKARATKESFLVGGRIKSLLLARRQHFVVGQGRLVFVNAGQSELAWSMGRRLSGHCHHRLDARGQSALVCVERRE